MSQGLAQFAGDMALNGKYRIGFEYTEKGDNFTTVMLRTHEQDGTLSDDYISILRNKLDPVLHTQMKMILRKVYGDNIRGKSLLIVAEKDKFDVGTTEHLHDEGADEIFTCEDIEETLAYEIREFAQAVLEFHMLFKSYVMNKGYTIGKYLQKTKLR